MKINNDAMTLIKEFEGCHLRAYKDAVGVWTIGYGITNADKSITGTTIKSGLVISQSTAEQWLRESLEKKYAPKVMKYQDKYHFNENQFGALVSFAFNIGSIDGLTANGTRSIEKIKEMIPAYCKAGGKVLEGLRRRRAAELKLFNTPIASPKKNYMGVYPALPPRGYYKKGDGYETYTNYRTQIERVQKALNWALEGVKGFTPLTVDKKYGKLTDEAVKLYQSKNGIPVNGCWGNKCNAKLKKLVR